MQKVTVDIFLSTIMPSLCVPKRLNTNPVVALLSVLWRCPVSCWYDHSCCLALDDECHQG